MFLIILFAIVFLTGTIASPPPPVLETPPWFLVDPAESVPLYNFYPSGVTHVQGAHKPVLSYGNPSEDTANLTRWIESFSVEERLLHLERFRDGRRRSIYSKILQDKWYSKYVMSSFFIDVRLLRLLVRFMTWHLREDEINLRTACDIIAHMREKFPNSFEYLTPEYVQEWYNAFGGILVTPDNREMAFFRIIGMSDQEIRERILSGNETQTVFVSHSPRVWSKFISEPRINRLRTTGYEY